MSTVRKVNGAINDCFLCREKGELMYGGMEDRHFSAAGKWSLFRCSSCGMIWLWPRPTPEEIVCFYDRYFTHDYTDGGNRLPDGFKRRLWKGMLAGAFGYCFNGKKNLEQWTGKLLGRISSIKEFAGRRVMWLSAKRGGRLLDVGCGNGVFAGKMRQLGWEVYGVEPDKKAAGIAAGKYCVEVIASAMEEVRGRDEFFDVVTASHVIEHVPDPVGFLRRCARVIKPSGRIIILTPNAGSLGHAFFGRDWVALDPPRHLFLFSAAALVKCVHSAGLSVLEKRSTVDFFQARWVWEVSGLIRQKKTNVTLDLQNKWVMPGVLLYAIEEALRIMRFDRGEELVLVAGNEKKGSG